MCINCLIKVFVFECLNGVTVEIIRKIDVKVVCIFTDSPKKNK